MRDGGYGGRPEPGTDPEIPPVPPLIDYSDYFTLDQATEDWLRARARYFSGFGNFDVLYEGYDQYGYFGESIFEAKAANVLD